LTVDGVMEGDNNDVVGFLSIIFYKRDKRKKTQAGDYLQFHVA